MANENFSILSKQKTNIDSCELYKKFYFENIEIVTNCN